MTETAITRILPGDSTQIHPVYTGWTRVIPIPPPSLVLSVGAPTVENFLVVGDAWAQLVSRYAPENATVVDIGCGCGRTARLLINNRWISTYIGFDVVKESIDWCRNFIAPHWHGTAEFHCFDVYSKESNPAGAMSGDQFMFPCTTSSSDVVFASSVFSHLLEPDAVHYLHEIRRVLKPGGVALLSTHNNVPPGQRFCGSETRIDIEPTYFVQLAAGSGP